MTIYDYLVFTTINQYKPLLPTIYHHFPLLFPLFFAEPGLEDVFAAFTPRLRAIHEEQLLE